MSDPLRQLTERSNRIGEDPSLVVYGGGNTSAKGTFVDHLGRQQEVMWVKGSGADMRASIESDYPGLRLGELTALRYSILHRGGHLLRRYCTRSSPSRTLIMCTPMRSVR